MVIMGQFNNQEKVSIDPASGEELFPGEIAVGDRFTHSTENFDIGMSKEEVEAEIGMTEFELGQHRTKIIVGKTAVLFGRLNEEIRSRL